LRINFMFFNDRGTDGPQHRRHVALAMLASDLVHDDQLFAAGIADGERGAELDRFVSLLHRSFDVLRVEVSPADDDDVLQPARDKQFALEEGAEVTRAEERPAAIGGASVK
jgi:hypothetical protein